MIFWGTFFPLISEFFTGEKHSLAAPWFDRYVTPIGVLLVLFTGIGPLLAWGRLSASAARRLLLWPALAALATIVVLLAVSDAGTHLWALFVFGFAAFTLVALAGEFWRAGTTRRALTGEPTRGRSPRRWGATAADTAATSCTPGLPSPWSGSPPLRASRPTATSACRSGSPPRSGTTRSTTTTSPLTRSRSASRSSPTSSVFRDGKKVSTLTPARNYYPTDDPTAGPIGRYFMGESTSEVGLRARASGDLWTAFQPDLSVLTPDIKRGNNQLAGLPPAAQEFAILALIQHYVKDPPPANFRVIVNPLVGWIWIGALIALAGAVMAGWPALESRRRLEAAYRARLGRELGPATPPS